MFDSRKKKKKKNIGYQLVLTTLLDLDKRRGQNPHRQPTRWIEIRILGVGGGENSTSRMWVVILVKRPSSHRHELGGSLQPLAIKKEKRVSRGTLHVRILSKNPDLSSENLKNPVKTPGKFEKNDGGKEWNWNQPLESQVLAFQIPPKVKELVLVVPRV